MTIPKPNPVTMNSACIAVKVPTIETAMHVAAMTSRTHMIARLNPNAATRVARKNEAATTDRSLHASRAEPITLLAPRCSID